MSDRDEGDDITLSGLSRESVDDEGVDEPDDAYFSLVQKSRSASRDPADNPLTDAYQEAKMRRMLHLPAPRFLACQHKDHERRFGSRNLPESEFALTPGRHEDDRNGHDIYCARCRAETVFESRVKKAALAGKPTPVRRPLKKNRTVKQT